jgi:hypothetical protein
MFTEGASYHERVMGEPIRGRDGIRSYWQTKVVGTQANITCELLNLYLDVGTAIAEWEATFDDTAQQVRKRMREVALLTFDGPLIDSLPSPTSSPTRTGDERHRALRHAGVLARARPLLPPGRWWRGRRPDPLPGAARGAGPLPYPQRPLRPVEACEGQRPR